MLTIQIIFLIFFALALVRVVQRYRARALPRGAALAWGLLWVMAGVVVVLPNSTARLAELLGVGRGADLVVYCALALIFLLLFRIMLKLNALDRNITLLARHQALREEKPSDKV